ncbi:hypothetical protein [Chitinophaga sp. CF418]|uniref:hypothetical protein n=1 Tax=Chitinophaga sp. CF418 TaxID=1855287 RepID=UPI00091B77B4|nr:hypothetical protein [Chitinophaga sp. CF418]SHL89907.1 hypothetical protein SAMN05216311_10173 [Chitinophaga sp. CF418]
MNFLRRPVCILIVFCCCILTSYGQTDKWVGTWTMEYKPWPTTNGIKLQLQIGKPERDMLYPAQLKVIYSPFSGTYEVLLAKKNDNQLGIGRAKYPVEESPFHLGAWMLYLNGTLNYQAKGAPELSLQRMWINSHELYMQGLYADDEMYAYMKDLLRELLSRKDIVLKKQNNIPWQHRDTRRILHPEADSIYFGIYDKVDVYDSIVPLSIRDEDAIDKDTVTLLLNGKQLLDKSFISETGRTLQLPLDSGINIVTLFADNYGRLPPNTGAFKVKTTTGAYMFDFTDRSNMYATFLVAQLNRLPRKPVKDTVKTVAANTTGEGNNIPLTGSDVKDGTGRIDVTVSGTGNTTGQQVVAADKTDIKHIQGRNAGHPVKDSIRTSLLRPVDDKRIAERHTSLLEKINVQQADVTFELWDDAAEDGDSISIRMNGLEVVTGFPVKRQRQQLKVTLQQGENRLIMLADNLGSIPPNTAVMRIVAGALRKYVTIKTDLQQNNMLLIIYEPEADTTGKQ